MAKKPTQPMRKSNQIRLSEKLGTPALLDRLTVLVEKDTAGRVVSISSIIHTAVENEIKRLEAKVKHASRKTNK